tara:strand:- start:52 stop:2439 length:2388 start_codon:yes stop_codon:yes gene_type:complete
MSYLSQTEINTIKEHVISDESELKREFRGRRLEYYEYSEKINNLDSMIKKGWEIVKENVNSSRIRKNKPYHELFEDNIWCLFYQLGFEILNKDNLLKLKYGIKDYNTQQIDVLAVNDEVAFVVECKSSQSSQNINYKKELESVSLKRDGYRKCINDLYGERKIKFVLATRNQSVSKVDKERLEDEGGFHLDDHTYSYMKSLIEKYKKAANYQIMATFFKGDVINNKKIKIPAIKGKMANKNYYMFSIEPEHLLKIGFVSHRTKANKLDMPTYQRLIVPSRLKSLKEYIDDQNGFFPNSVIINFQTSKKKLGWEDGPKIDTDIDTKTGALLIPNSYAFAYIIDGQHRIYGYAGSEFSTKHTIPVVAFENLSSTDQLEMFLKINQNQKAISKSLRITLEEDVYWNSSLLSERLKALISAIINYLGRSYEPLKSLLTVGEDRSVFSSDNISNALSKSTLIPNASKEKFIVGDGVLYDITNQNDDDEMNSTVTRVGELISKLYAYLEEKQKKFFNEGHKLFYSNRANFGLVYTLSEINKFLTLNRKVDINTKLDYRWGLIQTYFDTIFDEYSKLNQDEISRTLSVLGQGADKAFALLLLSLINKRVPDFTTGELEIWKETMDKNLQEDASRIITFIEEKIKKNVFKHLKFLFGDDYENQVSLKIVLACSEKATIEQRKTNTTVPWESMLNIVDYKAIIKDFWGITSKTEEDKTIKFQNFFSFNSEKTKKLGDQSIYEVGKVPSKEKGLKWFDPLNTYRNKIMHRATRAQGLTRAQVVELDTLKNTIEYSDELYTDMISN